MFSVYNALIDVTPLIYKYKCLQRIATCTHCLTVMATDAVIEHQMAIYGSLARQPINKIDRVCFCYYLLVPCQAVTVQVANLH